ncbi:hypothetical protein N786_12770 [Bacillus amyloliquefaciens UASWS BA1]|nr:hypothetical protein KSO_013770 [Bacillus amyloliquefaciens IT-45]ERK82687.1 hypothetical protein N786_12770 [Bacillus amyloliquefaciens UASWS BA1]
MLKAFILLPAIILTAPYKEKQIQHWEQIDGR